MLYANTSQIEITPSLGTVINGEFTCRYATQIADPLYAKALYLQYEQVKVLFVVVDICVMKREFLDPIKTEIANLTGIPASHQLISSTHTHSGGSVADLLLAHADLAYRELLRKKLIELAAVTVEEPKLAKIAFGRTEMPEHVTCRRYKMKDGYRPVNPVTGLVDKVKTNPFSAEEYIEGRTSTPDTEVGYVVVQTVEGRWLALLANYGLHYVGDCPRGTVSADYFGYFSAHLKKKLHADEMVVMMSNGTSGEINIWDFIDGDRYPKEDHAKSKYIGYDIANAVFDSLKGLTWEEKPDLSVHYEELPLAVRSLDPLLLQNAQETLGLSDYEALSHSNADLYEIVYAREQVLLSHYPTSIEFLIQCFKIGKLCLGALGGEFFASTGLQLKAVHPYYFTICLANDYVGYVPPREAFGDGGYETWRARSSFLGEECEEIIRLKMIEILST